MTAILRTDCFSGRTPAWFFNRTMAFRSASRASCRCSANRSPISVSWQMGPLWRIEHAQTEARHKEPLRGAVDLGFCDAGRRNFVHQRPILGAAVRSVPAFTAAAAPRQCGRVLVIAEDVVHRATIAHDVPWKPHWSRSRF